MLEMQRRIQALEQKSNTVVLALSNLLVGNHETAVEVLIAAAGSAGALDVQVDGRGNMRGRRGGSGAGGRSSEQGEARRRC